MTSSQPPSAEPESAVRENANTVARSDGPTIAPALVIGLDGASWDVIRPMIDAGRLPNLARWIREGASAPLRSTRPPVTFPAWSAFMTGLEPGNHGLFDFTQKLPRDYRIRFVNASDRAGASLFARISDAGGRVLVLGVPATYPPEPVRGLLVPGFDAPVSTGSEAESTSDPALYRRLDARVGPWMRPAAKESGGASPERTLETLFGRVEQKTAFALEALETLRRDGPVDFMMLVYSESDTVGHHYWRDHDPSSPRHDPSASPERRGAIEAVYEKLDAACGALRDAFGEDALCCVISDHGMGGAARYVVHVNRRLADHRLLARAPARGVALDGLARTTRDLLLRVLPSGVAQRLFRRARAAAARVESTARFGGFDWARTLAFSEEANTQPGVWINLRGREPHGCVAARDYEGVRDRVIDALRSWKLPDGEPVVSDAWRREEIYEGPYLERAPDVVFELALHHGHGLSLVATPWDERAGHATGSGDASVRWLADHELAGGRGRGMNGTHRRDGILIATGAGLALSHEERPALVDMAPTLLHAMGVPWRDEAARPADGRRLFADPHHRAEPRRYTDEEESMVAERLRALGYLE